MLSAFALPIFALQLASTGPILGALALRSSGDLPSAPTAVVIEEARPGFAHCLTAAHARAPLEEAGSLTLVVQVRAGAVVQAASVLRPARADLAKCLRERIKPLRFPAQPALNRVRVTADWVAPPPPGQANYPYAVKRGAPAPPVKTQP